MDPSFKGSTEVLNLVLLRHHRMSGCRSDLRHLRAHLSTLSCEDTQCILTKGCMRLGSSIIAGYVPPLVTVYALSRRLQNSLTRSTLRTAYESKHSPGFHHTYTAPLEHTGATSLDANLLFHASSHDLSGPSVGIGPRLMLYSHPILPLSGQFLRIVFPEECKEPGTDFELRCEFLDSCGDVCVEMSSELDPRRALQFHLYAFHLLSASTYMREFPGVLSRPQQIPDDIELPADLCPPGQLVILRGVMPDEEVGLLAQVLSDCLQLPVNQEFSAVGERMTQFQVLRQLLHGRNPFLSTSEPATAAPYLRAIVAALHQEESPYHRFADAIFPPGLLQLPVRACPVPYCDEAGCDADDAHFLRLMDDVAAFRAVERVPAVLASICEGAVPMGRYFPASELQRLETDLWSPVYDCRAPDGGFGCAPTALMEFLMARGWSSTDAIHHFTRRLNRVYGVYRSGSNRGQRSDYKIQQYIPSMFYCPTGKFLLSLRCELPTVLATRFLSFKPQERPDQDLPLHLDGNRRRNPRR
ncbi:unnamed protein product [Oikopleura dioica]|uniref:Uncharacterized protein n=1 Tax=Oikopleura dioica TaxID=34765 RepID=E4WTA6_OIKDI|nr:unnamed protein product [Oikopleura dioica]